jgi:hypothetical protein
LLYFYYGRFFSRFTESSVISGEGRRKKFGRSITSP